MGEGGSGLEVFINTANALGLRFSTYLLSIYINQTMCVCVSPCERACVRIDGHIFKPISMRFETWVPLILRRVKAKF